MEFGFRESLINAKKRKLNPIIAEIKPFSPIYGDLIRGRDPLNILKCYERAGAAATSYITAKQFKGNLEELKRICKNTDLPVLRKDFIRDKAEIERSAEIGVSALLLIARDLKDKTAEFAEVCYEHDIEPVVEVHRESELQYAESNIILINNRDITKMETDGGDVSVTAKLARKINKFKISGSGIKSLSDLSIALRYADAALIGTAFMLAEDPESFVRSFVEARL